MFDNLMSFKALHGVRSWLQARYAFKTKQSWYDFLNHMFDKIAENDTSERAASVSYSLILSVFPTVIFLFTLIPYIPIPDLEIQVMDFLRDVLPGDTFSTVDVTIRDIISQPRGGVLSLGFLLALYSATSGLVALMNAFNSAHESDERRGFFKLRIIAIGLTVTLALALILAIIILIVGGIVSDYLLHFGILNNVVFVNLLAVVRYLVVFAVFVAAVSVIYRYGPSRKMRWAFVTPGSVIASVLIVLTTLGFSFYVSNFSSYNKVYGSIGTVIALMIWINLIALLLIIGFDMNVALYNLGDDKKLGVVSQKTNATFKK